MLTITLVLAYLGGSFLFGAFIDLATNPQADWGSMFKCALGGPILVPWLILEAMGIHFR